MSKEDVFFNCDGSESPGPQAPRWLAHFANLAMRAFHSEERLAPVGCHFHRHDEGSVAQWEVTLFVSSTEVFGGAWDGERAVSRFLLDLRELIDAFDEIESVYWQAQTMAEDDQLGPHVGVEGRFQGHSIWLRVTAEPPMQFESGRVVDVCASEMVDRW